MRLVHAAPERAARGQTLLLTVASRSRCDASCSAPAYQVEVGQYGNVPAIVHAAGAAAAGAAVIEVPARFVRGHEVQYRIHASQRTCEQGTCRTLRGSTAWHAVPLTDACVPSASRAAAPSNGGHPDPEC